MSAQKIKSENEYLGDLHQLVNEWKGTIETSGSAERGWEISESIDQTIKALEEHHGYDNRAQFIYEKLEAYKSKLDVKENSAFDKERLATKQEIKMREWYLEMNGPNPTPPNFDDLDFDLER